MNRHGITETLSARERDPFYLRERARDLRSQVVARLAARMRREIRRGIALAIASLTGARAY